MTISHDAINRASRARTIRRRNRILFLVLFGFVLAVFASSMTHLEQETLVKERLAAP